MTTEQVTLQTMPLADLLANYRPGSSSQETWTWDDEEADILARVCLCCDQPGHYQQQLEAHLREHGLTQGVCLGDDGRVWDGHHRIVAARRLGIDLIPLESGEEAGERWLRDHGPVNWHQRKKGDRSPWEHEWRKRAARGDFGPDEQARVSRSLYDHYTVVNAQAGVWRCDRCGKHTVSPAEHEKEHTMTGGVGD